MRLHSYGPGALEHRRVVGRFAGLPDLESATKLLADAEGLAGLARKPLCELMEIKGIGAGKAAQLKADSSWGAAYW